ncbi:TPA: DoxX family protein [Escherichia coli]|nr:DoxX family protein [Escherichia coli]
MNTLRYFDFGAARPVLLLIARIAVVLIFIIFGFPKMMGFDGTVQYMASLGAPMPMLGAPMPMLAAIIAVVMEVPAAILIVLGFFTRPLAVLFIFYTLGTAVIGHHYWDMTGDAVGPNMINFWKNVSIAGAFLLLAITGPGAISLDRR